MAFDWSQPLFVAVIIAILAYLLNSWFQRGLVRSTRIYEIKLERYEKIVTGIQKQLESLRYLQKFWDIDVEEDEGFINKIDEILGDLIITHSLAMVLDTDACKDQVQQWNLLAKNIIDPQTDESIEVLKGWVDESLNTLSITHSRLFVHYGLAFNESVVALKLLPSRVTVGPATNQLVDEIFNTYKEAVNKIKKGEKSNLDPDIINIYRRKLNKVEMEMGYDLKATIAGIFGLIYIHRILYPAALKNYNEDSIS